MVPCLSELPLHIKADFENLKMVEEMLISTLFAIMSVYRLPGGALTNLGFCANFVQDLQPLLKTLPRVPKDLPILILKKKDQANNVQKFKVNLLRVERVLRWLCANYPVYIANNLKKDETIFNLLPDGSIPLDLNTADDTEAQNIDSILIDHGPKINDKEQEVDYEAFVESDDNEPLQIDNIRNSIEFPKAQTKAINEFEIESICSRLFPNGAGDPTNRG